MHKRRLARLALVVALGAAGGSVSLTACGGAKAGSGLTSPPSTSPK